jgi:hypothetical protein
VVLHRVLGLGDAGHGKRGAYATEQGLEHRSAANRRAAVGSIGWRAHGFFGLFRAHEPEFSMKWFDLDRRRMGFFGEPDQVSIFPRPSTIVT